MDHLKAKNHDNRGKMVRSLSGLLILANIVLLHIVGTRGNDDGGGE